MRLGGRRKGERWGQGWREEREGEMGKEEGRFLVFIPRLDCGDFYVNVILEKSKSSHSIIHCDMIQ